MNALIPSLHALSINGFDEKQSQENAVTGNNRCTRRNKKRQNEAEKRDPLYDVVNSDDVSIDKKSDINSLATHLFNNYKDTDPDVFDTPEMEKSRTALRTKVNAYSQNPATFTELYNELVDYTVAELKSIVQNATSAMVDEGVEIALKLRQYGAYFLSRENFILQPPLMVFKLWLNAHQESAGHGKVEITADVRGTNCRFDLHITSCDSHTRTQAPAVAKERGFPLLEALFTCIFAPFRLLCARLDTFRFVYVLASR
tara:strand:+ start:1004 stop:1774 length:771 start_codon:yes stop_codon:yes gene_type:complete